MKTSLTTPKKKLLMTSEKYKTTDDFEENIADDSEENIADDSEEKIAYDSGK